MTEFMKNDQNMFPEEETRNILAKVANYMNGVPAEDMKWLKERQDAFESAALEKLGSAYVPRMDDYKLCAFIAMLEKMSQQFKSNGGKIAVSDEVEALQLLALIEMARFLNMMTRPEEHHNDETGMMANNAEATSMQMEVDLN